MNNKCNGDCFSNYNEEEDDFVIQRLEDIIKICNFLIKHQKHSKSRESLKEMVDEITENEKPKNHNSQYDYYINKYTKPYYFMPYFRNDSWPNRIRF